MIHNQHHHYHHMFLNQIPMVRREVISTPVRTTVIERGSMPIASVVFKTEDLAAAVCAVLLLGGLVLLLNYLKHLYDTKYNIPRTFSQSSGSTNPRGNQDAPPAYTEFDLNNDQQASAIPEKDNLFYEPTAPTETIEIIETIEPTAPYDV
ncbi:hypothetical protein NEMIN01_0877 [Nematocida minor]|uniref:uncharacterized protein n=1 Tax=Nematocida minor TaxID=1912983 RepID=UPI00221F2929|nr:uncharacterized protein NEMIN01_0877 [Nematocida minor]KAI5190092.1 hypothetical protein NEMIN01_0877 [Nematocida minor]